MHDGAVIIRNNTILAARVILPLAEDDSKLLKSWAGTRHRAAIGMSRQTDAVVIVISEETGKVSIVREGIISRGLAMDQFRVIIRTVFNSILDKKEKFEDWRDLMIKRGILNWRVRPNDYQFINNKNSK